MQPVPQVGQAGGVVMGAKVGPVWMTGGHLDHFLGRCTPYVTSSACSARSVMPEANVRPGGAEGPATLRVIWRNKARWRVTFGPDMKADTRWVGKVTTLTVPARPERNASPRPVPWRRMAWVTWRQHRLALAGVTALFGVVPAGSRQLPE